MHTQKKPLRTIVFGASGFSGIELARLLLVHPRAELIGATSDRWAGETVHARLGFSSENSLTFTTHEQGLAAAASGQVAFLATPAEVSLELAPKLLERGLRVIDLSGAFRLKTPDLYASHYGFAHSEPKWLQQAIYGLPELSRPSLNDTRLIANPGCYATSAILGVAPLLKAGLIDPEQIVINAASGVSGAGRKASEDFSYMEIADDVRAYRVLRHQHTPEIEQAVGASVVFTPHLLPIKRGILCTTTVRLKKNATAASVIGVLSDAYAREPLMKLERSADGVRIASVASTPWCAIGASADSTHAVVVTALDNLLKGAASQAVQNFNRLIGCDETTGLMPAQR